MKQSDNPEQRSLADVLSVISELRTTVGGLEKRLENPESLVPPEYLRFVFDKFGPRSRRSHHMLMETRHFIEELSEQLLSNKPKTGKLRAEAEERLMKLRHDFDRVIHMEEW